jgi:hypothetical protein
VSGYVKAKIFSLTLKAEQVADFIYENIIYRYGCPQEILSDGGGENKGITDKLKIRYRIKAIKISPYNSKANGFLERSHLTLILALKKITDSGVLD